MNFDILQTTLLALIQGFTEFLPVSSSAHLILPSALLGWDDQGLAFDVAVHLGTLLSVVLYFRRDLLNITRAVLTHLVQGKASDDSRLGWHLILSSLPVLIAGFLLKDLLTGQLRSVSVLATTTIIFGLLLWYADHRSKADKLLPEMDWRISLIIGMAQVVALIPGASRSGITMTAAMFCNMEREAAARFSFLLSIPVIAGAATLLLLDLLAETGVNWGQLLYALVLAGLTAYLCIHFFLKLVVRLGFLPFVIYRLLLGLVLLLFIAQ